MSQKTKNAYQKDKIMHDFVEALPEYTGNTVDALKREYEGYKEGLSEIDCMIQHFQSIGNDEEVSFWRRLAMHNKMVMREIKEKMCELVATNNEREVAYS